MRNLLLRSLGPCVVTALIVTLVAYNLGWQAGRDFGYTDGYGAKVNYTVEHEYCIRQSLSFQATNMLLNFRSQEALDRNPLVKAFIYDSLAKADTYCTSNNDIVKA